MLCAWMPKLAKAPQPCSCAPTWSGNLWRATGALRATWRRGVHAEPAMGPVQHLTSCLGRMRSRWGASNLVCVYEEGKPRREDGLTYTFRSRQAP